MMDEVWCFDMEMYLETRADTCYEEGEGREKNKNSNV